MAGELRLYVIRVGGRQRAQVFGMVVKIPSGCPSHIRVPGSASSCSLLLTNTSGGSRSWLKGLDPCTHMADPSPCFGLLVLAWPSLEC